MFDTVGVITLLDLLDMSAMFDTVGDITLWGLLDMSAMFDTVNHHIVIHRFTTVFSVQRTVLSWIESFIRHQSQIVLVSSFQPSQHHLQCATGMHLRADTFLAIYHLCHIHHPSI